MSSIADDLSTITLPELRAIAVAHYSGHGGSRMTRPRVVEFLLRKLADEEHLLCTTSRRRGNPSSPPIEDLSTRAHQQMRTRYGPKLFDQYLRSSVRATDVRLVQPTSPAVDNESASDDLQNPVLETYEHPIETASWPEPISQELKDECSQAFRKGTAIALAATCAVCARRTFTEDVFYTKTHLQCKRVPISQLSLDILRITDPFILGHPGDHFTFGADELDGLALDANGVHITETSTELDVCDECRQYLNKAKLPPAALANGNIRGHLPESLRDCTWLEERLCAKYLASAYIVRLYDFTAPGAPAERPRVMKGHSCAFPLNTVATAARLPWSFDDGGPLLSCIVIGPRKPRLSDLRQVFKVRRQKVQDLLEYLKHNFKDYPQFDIDAAVLQSLPIDDVPELLMRSVVHQETGDVPSLFDFETAGIEPHAGLTADDDIAADLGRTFLEHHGMLDVNGVSIPSHARTASALSNATGTERPDLIIKHGSSFIQDYNNPQLFPGMFPLLFPWGIGGFESERDAPFSFNKQATYLLDLADPAFRRHWSFVFVVANIKQRRAIHNGSRLACKSRDYTAFSRTLAELDSDVVKRIAEHAASGGSLDTLCGEERKIFRLLSKCQVVSKKVPGSKAIMDLARADIRGYIGEHGIFQLFLTLNPHPAYGPPFQIFYGNNNINLDLRMPDMPPRATTAVQVADDPVAAADYFHFHVGAVFQYLFGWDVRKKASTSSGGILGRMAAFFLVKEHTMRGQLHGHALIWLEGALNPGPLRQKLRVDEAFQKKYLAFMDNLIVHEVPAPPTPLPISAIEHHFAPSAPDVRRPRTEMPPSPEQGDYRREFQSDQHLLGEELQRHTCRATCFKGGRNSCRFLFPHTINETPHFDPDDNSVNLRIRDANVNWYNPTLLVATRHNHDLKAIQSGKSSAAAAAYVTTYATKSDETPVNQIAMINTVFQRLDQCGDLHTETKTLLSKCVMQFGRERQLHAQQVATYVRDLGDTFQSHKTVPMLSGSMLAHVFQLWGPPRVKEADVVVFTETSDAIALGEVGEEDDEQDSFTHAEYGDSLLSLSAAGLAHQVTDYMHRGPTLQDVTFYDFVQRAKLFPAPKELYKTHHPLSQSHPNVDSHCHRYNPATSHGIPRAVFRRWPRPDGTPLHGDLYCAAMLLHFRAFSVTNPLKSSETTYEAVFHQTPFPQHALKIMANWNALTECDDARDEQQLLRRKREALRGAGQDDVVAIDTREGMDDQNADVNTAALKAQGRNESRETSAFSAALSGGSWFDTTNTSTIQDCLPATYQCPPFTPSRRRQWKKQQDEVEATTKADRSVAKATSGVLAQDLGFDKHFQAGKVLTCSTFDFDDVQNPNLPADTLRLRWETTQPHILIQDLIKERGLNASQALTFKIVARHFFQELYGSSQSPLRLLMHGEAGTGKTVVVRLLRELLDRFGRAKEIMFLAPTGKAASAIGGVTQHSAFCLGIVRKDKSSEEGSSNADEISARRMQHLTTAFKDVRWLFFDEVSMTSCEIMAEIDQGLRIGKQRLDEPFGGANVIFAGDLCQLPPVSACPLYVQDTPFAHSADVRTKIALGRAAWIHIDQVVDFTHQMRMKDARMAAALSRLRLRRCISEDADLLNGNVLRSPDNPNGATLLNHPGAVVLARTNETVRILNLRKAAVQAQSTSAKLVISHAQDVSSASIGEEDRQLLLAYNGSTRTRSAVGRVPLFIGMPVVYRGPNISVPLGVTNGAFATVAGWDLGLDRWGMTTPRGVVLRFTEDAPWSLAGLEPGCLPITPIKTTFKFKASTDAEAQQVTRNQLPLQAGYAMTVHAAQGVTAQGGIVVDLRRGGFEAYVAASRATRAEDVFLIATTSIRELNHPLLPTPLQIELHRLEQIAVRSKLIHDNDTWRLVQSLKRASASEDPSPRPTQRRRTSAQLASNSR